MKDAPGTEWRCLHCGQPVPDAWKYDMWCPTCQDRVMAVQCRVDGRAR